MHYTIHYIYYIYIFTIYIYLLYIYTIYILYIYYIYTIYIYTIYILYIYILYLYYIPFQLHFNAQTACHPVKGCKSATEVRRLKMPRRNPCFFGSSGFALAVPVNSLEATLSNMEDSDVA